MCSCLQLFGLSLGSQANLFTKALPTRWPLQKGPGSLCKRVMQGVKRLRGVEIEKEKLRAGKKTFEKGKSSHSPSELVGPWQAVSSHLQVVSRASNAGWLHPSRGLWCSKGREPWPLSWQCAQGPHGQVCQGCFCAWAYAGPSSMPQPQILEKGKGRSSSYPSTHALLQLGNTAQLQWNFSNSTAGTILANSWKKMGSSFGRAPHEDQELEKVHHSTLCPWGWCSICQQQFFNGLVLGSLDDMLQLLAKQVPDLLQSQQQLRRHGMICWRRSAGHSVLSSMACTHLMILMVQLWKRDRPSLQAKGNHWQMDTKVWFGQWWVMLIFLHWPLACPTGPARGLAMSAMHPPALPIRESISKIWKWTPKPSQWWPMHRH